MSQPILVTGAVGGAQGSTGRHVAGLLLEQGIPARALVHKLDSRSDELRQQRAELVEGDLLTPASIQAAMRNVKRAFLADRIFDWARVGAVHLQAPPYYENVRALVSRSVAGQSTVFLPWGADTTVIPLVGAEDVSRVAATLLAHPGAESQNAYALVGETPTVKEMTEALGRAIGRPIRYVAATDEQWSNAVKERLRPHALDHLSHLWQNFRKGEERYQTTDSIREVTGRNPQTLEEFFRRNSAFFAGTSQEA